MRCFCGREARSERSLFVKRLFWLLPVLLIVAVFALTAPAQADTTYVAVRGDTLSKIACMFDVPLGTLIAANAENLPNPNLLVAGKRITIPGRDGGPVKDCTTPTPTPSPTRTPTRTPTATSSVLAPTSALGATTPTRTPTTTG